MFKLVPAKFRVLQDRTIHDKLYATKGQTVYQFMGCDYGLANDDSRWTGIEHTSVTFNEDGSHPSFTIPVDHLERIPQQVD